MSRCEGEMRLPLSFCTAGSGVEVVSGEEVQAEEGPVGLGAKDEP